MKPRIEEIAHELQTDIDPIKSVDALRFDKLVNLCVVAATTALDNSVGPYTEFERWHFAQIFKSMGHSHRSVRNLVTKGRENPESVDALIIARAQIEWVFTAYVLLEKPETFAVFLKDAWRKKYIRYLIERQECRNLPRFGKFLNEQAEPALEALRNIVNVSDEEKQTIEAEYLGTALPNSGSKKIPTFPTPGQALSQMKSPTKKAVLDRLYFEYVWLCSFVHGSPESTLARAMFDKRSKYIELFSTDQHEDAWRKEVGEKAVLLSVLSVGVCTAELVEIYRSDIELRRAAGETCGELAEFSLLAQSLWQRRLKQILGVI
ncbi:MAG: hypothetical protein HYX72_02285 [Acidobacteria bacterium]|nr:hypothetical protein [Acidobacteriota bacterium]